MVAPAMANCADGRSCVGPGVKRRFLRIILICPDLNLLNDRKQDCLALEASRSTTTRFRLDGEHLHLSKPGHSGHYVRAEIIVTHSLSSSAAFASFRAAIASGRVTVGKLSMNSSSDLPCSRASKRLCRGTRVPTKTGSPFMVSGSLWMTDILASLNILTINTSLIPVYTDRAIRTRNSSRISGRD